MVFVSSVSSRIKLLQPSAAGKFVRIRHHLAEIHDARIASGHHVLFPGLSPGVEAVNYEGCNKSRRADDVQQGVAVGGGE